MTHRRAVALMVLATLMWSIAGVVTRHIEAARGFEMTFWRSVFTALALILALSVMRGAALWRGLAHAGWPLWVSGGCWAMMYIAFMLALSLTYWPFFTRIVYGARVSLATTLKGESGQSSATRATAGARKALVCAQVTISAVLLIPTGLFLKSLVNLTHVDLGMNTENVIGFSVSPSLNAYAPERSRALYERMERELAAIPGVRSVADSQVALIAGDNWGSTVKIDGAPRDADYHARYNEIGAGFLGEMGTPLIAGREFTASDNLAGPKVARIFTLRRRRIEVLAVLSVQSERLCVQLG